MPITITLDVLLRERNITSKALAQEIGITEANLSILKKGHAKAIRFSTLESLCKVLNCQPGDILQFNDE